MSDAMTQAPSVEMVAKALDDLIDGWFGDRAQANLNTADLAPAIPSPFAIDADGPLTVAGMASINTDNAAAVLAFWREHQERGFEHPVAPQLRITRPEAERGSAKDNPALDRCAHHVLDGIGHAGRFEHGSGLWD